MAAFVPCPTCGRPSLAGHACPGCQPSGRRIAVVALLGATLSACQAMYGVMVTDEGWEPPRDSDATDTDDSGDDTDAGNGLDGAGG